MRFPFSRFEIHEESMSPQFIPGDRVVTVRKSTYQVGDVVILKAHRRNFIKRVKKTEDTKYLIGGNNRKSSRDFMVDKKQIIGKVILKY